MVFEVGVFVPVDVVVVVAVAVEVAVDVAVVVAVSVAVEVAVLVCPNAKPEIPKQTKITNSFMVNVPFLILTVSRNPFPWNTQT